MGAIDFLGQNRRDRGRRCFFSSSEAWVSSVGFFSSSPRLWRSGARASLASSSEPPFYSFLLHSLTPVTWQQSGWSPCFYQPSC